MKRVIQFLCLLLILSTILAMPVAAVESTPLRGSDYFMSRLAYLYVTSGTNFEVWIEVAAKRGMDELGASSITVQRSSDNKNWTDMKTYLKEDYPDMITYGSGWHDGCVEYTGTSGYYYRAKVWFYAKDETGTGKSSYTTDSILL